MKKEWKSEIKVLGYLALLMLLLFCSLPLSGVLADDDINQNEADMQEAVIEQGEEETDREKTKLSLHVSIEKEGQFSYREDYDRSVMLSLWAEGLESGKDADILYTITSSNEAVIALMNPQEVYSLQGEQPFFRITGVGYARLTIEPLGHAFYTMEVLEIPIAVKNSSLYDEDICILYIDKDGTQTIFQDDVTKWLAFVEERENWLNGSVQIQLSQAGRQYYAGIGYTVNQEINQMPESQQLFLSDEMPMQQYDFWCSNVQRNAFTKEENRGTHTFIAGIDKTAPESTGFTYNQNFYEPASSDTTRYYGENLTITGCFQDMLSGVKSIEYTTQADMGENAQWTPVQSIIREGNKADFELVLEHGHFTGIAIRAEDAAGNLSEPLELKNQIGEYLTIIVDKTQPELSIMSKTLKGELYQGTWTNQPITIFVQESPKDVSLSGIQSIQYQYVSIGGKYQSDKWEELPTDGLLEIGYDRGVKTDQNGIYYFRAITHTGMVTAVEAQKENAVRIRLQQTMAAKEDIIETAPKLEQNQAWYNKKSGVPFLTFSFPEYDNGVRSLEYDAPITVHTSLSVKHTEEEEMLIRNKMAVIGITDDKVYQSLCAGEPIRIEDNLQNLAIDFSYEQETGYAEDGIYQLEYWITDAAGNESEHDIYIYQIDTHEPEALEVLVDGKPIAEDTSQTIVYERFYSSAVSCSASADFGSSGKGSIKLYAAEEIGDWENDTNEIRNDAFTLKPCTRGCIYMVAEDAAGNQSVLRTRGIVVDNQPPIGENGGKFISVITKANEHLFFHENVELKFSARDLPQEKGFSGIQSFSYTVGNTIGTNKKELFSFTKELPDKEELLQAQSFALTEVLDASVYEGNDIYVDVTVTDRCGNMASGHEELKIDITEPKVEITFDQNEPQNGFFYHTARTATIHVEELNFDSQGVMLEITKDKEPYILPISPWETEGNNHWATVTFAEDGDYTMKAVCTDLADNDSAQVCVEPFTIDLTKPVIEIAYDNSKAVREEYFQTGRTAYITVTEHNFREEDFVITAKPAVQISSWHHEGDKHDVQISFREDAHYRFWCDYADLAGNMADTTKEQDFYIDSIAPQIVIQGVEDGSANSGEIRPIITVYDTNLNRDGVHIHVETGLGENVPLTIEMQGGEQGYSYIMTDMSEKEDNIYFLTVIASDMAGNQSEVSYRFSLNRNGSAYDLSGLSQITRRIYNRFDQLSDISIIEMNVDKIENYAIYITRNGVMLSARESRERSSGVMNQDEICYYVEQTGNEQIGYTNRYVFYHENFSKEGIYHITCYSKDEAGNEMNNTLEAKQAEIFFIIDNTPPKVIIEGIETGGIYNEEVQTVNIMVQDNFRLEKAYFTLVNEAGEELESWDYMELAKEAGDIVTIQIPALDAKQSLLYRVSDAAGNELIVLPKEEGAASGFLITTNKWLQFISSPVKLFCVIGIVILGVGAGMWYLIRQKHLF